VHRLFATARWCADAVGLALLDLIVDRLLQQESPITVVVDDTKASRAVWCEFRRGRRR
jgi:hypothetical protein